MVSQDPAPGTQVEKGTAVNLRVGAEKAAPETVEVPDLAGKLLIAAKVALSGAGLKTGEVTEAPGEGEPGKVVSQDPAPGTQVEKGTAVDLRVGAEKPPEKTLVKVPSLEGLRLTEARAKLRSAGLSLGRVQSVVGEGEPGRIFSQDPPAGSDVDRGVAVSVKVGERAAPRKVSVPGLKGLSREEAEAKLEQAGLRVGEVTQRIFAGKGGQVLEQSIQAGRNMEEGTAVDLVIAREPEGEVAVVPDLKGMLLLDASRKLEALGLTLSDRIESRVDNRVPPGSVIGQEPEAGVQLERGSEVRVTIAKKGAITYEVPAVTGKPREEAERLLKDKGFGVGSVASRPVTDEAQAGVVLAQDPAGGTKVKERGSVNLVLGKKAEETVLVPGLKGLPRARAETVLLDAGLMVGTVKESFRTDEETGTVLEQDPEAGTRVRSGTAVNLTVARKAGDLVKVPVILLMTLDEARRALEEVGLALGVVEEGKTYMKEIVVRQEPYPNKRVPKGTAVDVIVTTR